MAAFSFQFTALILYNSEMPGPRKNLKKLLTNSNSYVIIRLQIKEVVNQMYKYQIFYECSDGFVGTEYVYAINRMMAFEMFKDFGYENVVNVDCLRIKEEE